jgi:hypothetical protein
MPTRSRFARDDLLKRRDLELPVEDGVRRTQVGQALLRPQRPELGEREVLGEPAGDRDAVDHLRGAATRELRALGDVRRARDVVLVPCDEDVILRRDEVGLDVVGSQRDGELVRRERVLRPVAARSSVSDHDRAGVGSPLALRAARPAL